MLHHLYSQLARARRRYYRQRPHLRRRLACPVISVGNLTVGGSGKTPLVVEIARMLLAMGERPSILSRGYGRRRPGDGVVVVSDGRQILSDVDRSGDEPFMMARQVPQASVLVSSSRYLAGRLAESRLAATVHILDDGFQHFDLLRDVDLLIAPDMREDTRTLPFGRFREPLDAATDADALLVEVSLDRAEALCHRSQPPVTQDSEVAQDFSPVVEMSRAGLAVEVAGLEVQDPPYVPQGSVSTVAQDFSPVVKISGAGLPVEAAGLEMQDPPYVPPAVNAVAQDFSPVAQTPRFTFTRRIAAPPPDGPAFAFAGIAKPDRFYRDLEADGWQLTGRKSFRDHHPYSQRDIDEVAALARRSGAVRILTTEKDAVRLPVDVDLPIVAVALNTSIEPRFGEWIADRLRRARTV